MKLFPKLAIIFFVGSCLILLLTPHSWWPSFYDLPYMGIAALVCALAIFLIPEQFKISLALILLFNASGDLGLYELYRYGFEYDKVIHFVSPVIAVLALCKAMPLRRAVLIVIAGALAWELFEYSSDALIKTHLFGVYRQHVWSDTIMDLVMNALGVIIAAAWTFFRMGFGGQSTPKLPIKN